MKRSRVRLFQGQFAALANNTRWHKTSELDEHTRSFNLPDEFFPAVKRVRPDLSGADSLRALVSLYLTIPPNQRILRERNPSQIITALILAYLHDKKIPEPETELRL